MNIIYPFGWRIIRTEVRDSRLGWAFERPSLLCNLFPIPAPDLQSLEDVLKVQYRYNLSFCSL
jgi:hypothetical protein